jgi:hypothetical protein
MPRPTVTYNLGFTAYGLGATHALALATVYHEVENWDVAKDRAITENVFRQAKSTSVKRLEREFRQRLQTLTRTQLDLLVEYPDEARIPIALLAVFKRYRNIRDFAEDTLLSKYEVMDFEIRPSDYAGFIERMEPAHPELSTLTALSAKKIRQVTFRMLTEGQILSTDDPPRIAPSMLPTSVVLAIREEDPALLRPFIQP